jgi:hypothetical protein
MKWADFIVPTTPFKDEEAATMLQSFQYAGPLRIPEENFQIRSRKEVSTKDAVNARFVETWGASVPIQQQEFYRTDLPDGGIITKATATPRTPQEKAVLNAFPLGNVTVQEVRLELSRTENKVPQAIGNLTYRLQQEGREDAAPKDSRVPVAMEPVFMDMAPLSSRTDKRDFRQSKPYDPLGPSLALNPFFDRYDPTRDPRNMVREVRSVVYETKEADRGLKESERMRERTFTNRYYKEEETPSKVTEWFDLMRPKIDNPEVVYRQNTALWKLGGKYNDGGNSL